MISFIVPTIGRPTLTRTLRSIEARRGDEILVVGSVPQTLSDPRPRYFPVVNGGDWGCFERSLAITQAHGTYLAFLDDDDEYVPGARDLMARVMEAAPQRPVLFRMQYPNGFVLWAEPDLRCGNVSTQMILIPNQREKLGEWCGGYTGDFRFLQSMKWDRSAIVWQPEVIARIGHDQS
jgi:glycosyltransferase involved in cell wall biosynthesis